jgi:hypothetical protein
MLELLLMLLPYLMSLLQYDCTADHALLPPAIVPQASFRL